MSGISPASGVRDARHALFAAIKTALAKERDVDIAFGFRWPVVHRDWVALTSIDGDMEPAIIAPRRQQQETITFHASIGSWRPGHDDDAEKAAFDRAFGLLATIQDHIRQTDPTLGDTVLWCLPGSSVSDGATTNDDSGLGRLIEVDASFVCSHRVRTT